MISDNDLYTDYALQIFSSYMSEDISTMQNVLESFKDDGKAIDEMFFPGVIYGFMYHMSTLFNWIARQSETSVDTILASYAMDYAVEREDLITNPLLNVKKAKEIMDDLMGRLQNIEDFPLEDM